MIGVENQSRLKGILIELRNKAIDLSKAAASLVERLGGLDFVQIQRPSIGNCPPSEFKTVSPNQLHMAKSTCCFGGALAPIEEKSGRAILGLDFEEIPRR